MVLFTFECLMVFYSVITFEHYDILWSCSMIFYVMCMITFKHSLIFYAMIGVITFLILCCEYIWMLFGILWCENILMLCYILQCDYILESMPLGQQVVMEYGQSTGPWVLLWAVCSICLQGSTCTYWLARKDLMPAL